MPADRLRDLQDAYDVIVIGAGLAGLTAANNLAKQGRSVLLLEQHYNYGGMATWFRRKGGQYLRYLAARLSDWHDQELPQILDAGNRGFHRAAQEHSIRQSAVFPDHDV